MARALAIITACTHLLPHRFRLRVELARGVGQRGSAAPPRSGFKVLVKGLPRSASWQDLKVCEIQHVRV